MDIILDNKEIIEKRKIKVDGNTEEDRFNKLFNQASDFIYFKKGNNIDNYDRINKKINRFDLIINRNKIKYIIIKEIELVQKNSPKN